MLTEEKKKYIRKALINGVSVPEIMAEMQVSRSTVKRIKSQLPAQIEKEALETDDIAIDTSDRKFRRISMASVWTRFCAGIRARSAALSTALT